MTKRKYFSYISYTVSAYTNFLRRQILQKLYNWFSEKASERSKCFRQLFDMWHCPTQKKSEKNSRNRFFRKTSLNPLKSPKNPFITTLAIVSGTKCGCSQLVKYRFNSKGKQNFETHYSITADIRHAFSQYLQTFSEQFAVQQFQTFQFQ